MSLEEHTTAERLEQSSPQADADTLAGEGEEGEFEGTSRRRGRSDGELALGTTLGRYMVLGHLGRGSMGVVYSAYDPQLDRRVALKVLNQRSGDPSARRRSRRLQREAQAMAQLSHPNVISVYDVGAVDDRVFVAMELVQGKTLGDWLRRRKRRWTEIVEVFVAAGRGLQAAHLAGLVHRDFKPDNVLVGDDQRVRVTDFGIARPARSLDSEWSRSRSHEDRVGASSSARVLDLTLTRPGALAGTPAYMSPEQFNGGTLDARGDQFSFCVALWGALYGEAPFAGVTAVERAASVSGGVLRDRPSGIDVPHFVYEVLVRGLAVDPADRHRDMAALLDLLEHRPIRRRWVVGAVGGLALMSAGVAVLVVRPGPCDAVDELMAQTWNEDARQTVRSAIVSTGLPYAEDTWTRLDRRLDAYSDAWRGARVRACRATKVEESQSEAQLERQVECLERQRARLGALLGVLADANEKTVQRASAAVAAMPWVERCNDPRVLVELPAEPDHPRMAELVERYHHLSALDMAGHYQEAYEQLPALLDDAEAIDPGGVGLDTLALGAYLAVQVAPDEAEEMLRRAYFAAVRRHRDERAAELATQLVFFVGYQHARTDDGQEWSDHASAAIDRAGSLPAARIRLLKAEGDVLFRAGELEKAQLRHERAQLQLAELDDSPDRMGDEILLLQSLAAVKIDLNQVDDAEEDLKRALALTEELYGPRHPATAGVHLELGNLAFVQSRLEEAKKEYQTAFDLRTMHSEPEPQAVKILNNIGNVYDLQGHTRLAQSTYEQALKLGERVYGPEHPEVAVILVNLGFLLEHQEQDLEARRLYARALQIREQVYGPKHTALANPLLGVARIALEQGEVAITREHAQRALELAEEAGQRGEPRAAALVSLGAALARQGEVATARTYLQQMIEICNGHECNAAMVGLANLELGALARAEGDTEALKGYLDRANELFHETEHEGKRYLARLAELRGE